jgi:hypothetical protein
MIGAAMPYDYDAEIEKAIKLSGEELYEIWSDSWENRVDNHGFRLFGACGINTYNNDKSIGCPSMILRHGRYVAQTPELTSYILCLDISSAWNSTDDFVEYWDSIGEVERREALQSFKIAQQATDDVLEGIKI